MWGHTFVPVLKVSAVLNVDFGKIVNVILVHLHRFLIDLSHIADLKHARMRFTQSYF
jgi:hypothetical protein